MLREFMHRELLLGSEGNELVRALPAVRMAAHMVLICIMDRECGAVAVVLSASPLAFAEAAETVVLVHVLDQLFLTEKMMLAEVTPCMRRHWRYSSAELRKAIALSTVPLEIACAIENLLVQEDPSTVEARSAELPPVLIMQVLAQSIEGRETTH